MQIRYYSRQRVTYDMHRARLKGRRWVIPCGKMRRKRGMKVFPAERTFREIQVHKFVQHRVARKVRSDLYFHFIYTFIDVYRCPFVAQRFSVFYAIRIFHSSRNSEVFRRGAFPYDFLRRPNSLNVGTKFPGESVYLHLFNYRPSMSKPLIG